MIRLLPALTITDEQIDEGCAILADVLRQVGRLSPERRTRTMLRHFVDLLGPLAERCTAR